MKIYSATHRKKISEGLKKAYSSGVRKPNRQKYFVKEWNSTCACGCGTVIKIQSKHPNVKYKFGHQPPYWLGKKQTPEHTQKLLKNLNGQGWNKGIKKTKYCSDCGKKINPYGKNIFCLKCVRKGNRSVNWKGGITKERDKLKHSQDYILWRIAIFMRDNYTCQMCGQRGGELNADHIKPWALYPELRFAIDNGRTLCINCHKQTDTWGGRVFKYVEN